MEDLKKKRVVVIGGGTGTSILLRGLKDYPVHLSAIITTADTGGSSGRLREETGMAPPGDARQCFVALNDANHPILSHFNTRFSGGNLKGHTFGNLFLALLWQNYGDFQHAIEEAEKLFGSKHSVIPVTKGATNLVANLKDGQIVAGESSIIQVENLNEKLKNMMLVPHASLNPKAKRAIENADHIVIGPGNLFASLTPPLLVDDMVEAVKRSSAQKIYVANLMNQKKLNSGYTLSRYLEHFEGIFGEDIFNKVVHNKREIGDRVLRKYGVEDDPVIVDSPDARYVEADLVDTKISKQDPNDPLKRTFIRHDSKKLAKAVWGVINNKQ
ncbi:MAG: gluconeogenesis factor YvcK family protein [Candidatus Spechtbacterales bacterium]